MESNTPVIPDIMGPCQRPEERLPMSEDRARWQELGRQLEHLTPGLFLLRHEPTDDTFTLSFKSRPLAQFRDVQEWVNRHTEAIRAALEAAGVSP